MSEPSSKTGTREWADKTVNCCTGCSHDCVYCYAAADANRFGRVARGHWSIESPTAPGRLPRRASRVDGVVMFPSAHDITTGNLSACLHTIGVHLAAGNRLLIVSKPREAIWWGQDGVLDMLARHSIDRLAGQDSNWHTPQVLLRFSIGAVDERLREFWEPGAPPFAERIRVLKFASDLGFATSVSAEPLLDPAHVVDLYDAVMPYVSETLWIGAMNQVARRVGWKYPATHPMVAELLAGQTPDAMSRVYDRLHGDPKVRWKDSYQKALHLKGPEGRR